jgi:hypothetical protein
LRFKPPAAVLSVELVQHAGALRPSHAGLDPGKRGLGARLLAVLVRRTWFAD